MKHVLVLLILLILPIPAVFASPESDLLRVRITATHVTVVCVEQNKCQAIFLIEGKNFVNSNGGRRGVKIGNDYATILRWTDTQIVASTSVQNKDRVPLVSVDTTLQIPTFTSDNSVFEKMFNESVRVAVNSVRQASDGSRYFIAGPKYTSPGRTYYRDAYWTSGLLLFIEPAFVRDEILLLARGIEPNGSVPSAIPVNPTDRKIPLWTDHVDSGPYFVLMVYDYIRFTGDVSILNEQKNDRTIYEHMRTILAHLADADRNGNFLPEKPVNSLQDWLDSIPREGEIISNEVLYFWALANIAELSTLNGRTEDAAKYRKRAAIVKQQINRIFWNAKKEIYAEQCIQDVCNERLTNESALAVLFDVAPAEYRKPFFRSLQGLETRNIVQANGDWGVLNAFPLYDSAGAFSYQNGTDWPVWDAVNAGARLKFGDPNWEYPLTRWWTYFNEHKTAGTQLPEYVSPFDQHTGLDQAWSTAPITTLIRYGMGVDPDINGNYFIKQSPKGKMILSNIMVRGKRKTISIK